MQKQIGKPARRAAGRAALVLSLVLAVGREAGAQSSSGFVSVSATSFQSGHPPEHAVDGSVRTRWTAPGPGQSITGDFGRVATVSAMDIAWYRGARRSYAFRIEVGDADGAFRTVLSTSSGATSSPQRYAFAPASARWVRIVVDGSSADQAAISEMAAVVSSAPAAPDVTVAVAPTSATLAPGATQQFTATVTDADDAGVTWSVQEGAAGGSIDASGLYTAPATSGTFHVAATSVADPSRSAVATVTVAAAGGGEVQEVLAFPGAEGFGARATGGRGGQVLRVTTLNASGAGSLQAALNVNAPRIIVFAVSGVIRGDVTVPYGNVTIAGQTAPGGGITIAGRLTGAYDSRVQNIIARHLRVRPPRCTDACNADQYDAIQFSRNSRLVLDHISVAYGADETVDLYSASDVTVQWSSIEASQIAPQHSDGAVHNYGFIQGPEAQRISFHHNACAHHRHRCPAIANGPADVRNNVVYDVRHAFVHHNPAAGGFNFVGNYFKDGPSAAIYPFFFDDEDPATRPSYYHLDGFMDDPAAGVTRRVDDLWASAYWGTLNLDASHRSTAELDFGASVPGYVPVTTSSSTDAYAAVLAKAGAFPRDAFTAQTMSEIQTRTGRWDPPLPADLMAGLTPAAPPPDADADGMADAWEREHGLDPTNGADHATTMASGYTAIEDYINGLAASLVQ